MDVISCEPGGDFPLHHFAMEPGKVQAALMLHRASLAESGPGKAGAATGLCLAVPNHGHCSCFCSKGSSPLILNNSMKLLHCFSSEWSVLLPGLTPIFIQVLLCCTWGILNNKGCLIIHMYKSYPKSSVIACGKVTATVYDKYLLFSLFFNIICQ